LKQLTAILFALILSFGFILGVNAQAAESIWMETSQNTYSAGEAVTVTIKAISATPIQGFTFRINYDPACLQPDPPTSLLSGLNYMSVPQTAGVVDAIFASPTPLNANGALAEVKFNALANCQTSLKLESASLAIADASGMAVSLPGISLGASSLDLSVGGGSSPLPTLGPESNPAGGPGIELTPATIAPPLPFNWLILLLFALLCLLVLIGLVIAAIWFTRGRRPAGNSAAPVQVAAPTLFINRGPMAGTTLPIVQFPCRIGSGSGNQIRLSDPRIAPEHAVILSGQNGYTLVDLGSQEGTYLNGQLLRNQQAPLNRGDALRLGGVLLVFSPG
jgi:hypothetical protein